MMSIDETLVRRIVSEQFPQWANLPVRMIERSGWDNRTFHLGEDMSVRIPSDNAYAPQVEKEHLWLPTLAPQLPLPIPCPIAMGQPTEGLPWRWSIYRWLPGDAAAYAQIEDQERFARDLGAFISIFHRLDASAGPPAGAHNFLRGAPPSVYDGETLRAIELLAEKIDGDRAVSIWENACRSCWSRPPVWVHGDISAGNLLVQDGRLSAVIDFGSLGVGDPACDLTIAWTFFHGASRAAFRKSLALDDDTWARARGWALWKALVVTAGMSGADAAGQTLARGVLKELLSEEETAGA
jgi:aminoglycoside phosphotransferase (APT) family kinase protein